jgi:cytoskeletal protein CcmA (bactofilin family)
MKGGSVAEATISLVGLGNSIKGHITAQADLYVYGQVEGDITCASLVLGETGEVTGKIRAEQANLAGLVHGPVTASNITIQETARLYGDLQYDTLTIKKGAAVDGHLSPRDAHLFHVV